MTEQKYYIIKNNQVQGPMDCHSILKKIDLKEFNWLDKASLVQGEDLVSQLRQSKPLLCYSELSKKLIDPLSSSIKKSNEYLDREWYMFRSNMPIGPFSRLEMIQMLQEKTLDPESFIWSVGAKDWKKVYEWNEFSYQEVQNLLKSKNSEIHQVFYRRKYLRAQFSSLLIVNDEKKMFHGSSLEISEGGVGIKLKDSDFKIGHRIFLHFKSGEGVPAFNAVGEIVSRRYPKDNGETEILYGVKFLNVSNYVKDSIRTYTTAQQVDAA